MSEFLRCGSFYFAVAVRHSQLHVGETLLLMPQCEGEKLHIRFYVQFVTLAWRHAKLLYVMPSQIVASSLSHREQSYGKGYFSPVLTVKQLLHHPVKKHYNSSECASAIIADFYGTRYRE